MIDLTADPNQPRKDAEERVGEATEELRRARAGHILTASYHCARCGKYYIVNDGTWRLCTPEFCHDCLAHLGQQSYVQVGPESEH